ncbi:hypothetical protein Corgl_1569 [Coriobacterium glomerans PW2]|uniref:Carbon monoxide dehydrogenase subunit G n=1 Tax=Coriobacterium glomerans (strain ATCC 49209 / DSM 20642 / JCM 10262 / PW2) TaxID=700015 RepID=F2NAZ0_CORGP|nr:DUF3284 domain-containing protein [Coriobacterium glomerans]AEB07668.1 hypothetical protein Corgl_1569 [Coriobacterium glomerans PW2]
MRIVRTLDITSDEFFDYLEQRLLTEIEHATGERHAPSVLKAGFRYVSDPDDRYRRAEVRILAYVRGIEYRLSSVTATDDVTIGYRIEPHAGGIEVTYTQEIGSDLTSSQGPLMRGFSQAVYLSRMAQSLMAIQDAILDARDGVPVTSSRGASSGPSRFGSARPGRRLRDMLIERKR